MKKDQINLIKLSEPIFDRYFKHGYDKLSQHEQLFVCIWELETEVNNGGIHQFYFNSSGNHALETVKFLETIGAKHTANMVQEVNALFGKTGPLSDWSLRQKQLLAFEDVKVEKMNEFDKEYYKYNDNIYQMLEGYVVKNAEHFGLK